MKKALSLKKKAAEPSKDQKSITSFFKKSGETLQRKPDNEPLKGNQSKRKHSPNVNLTSKKKPKIDDIKNESIIKNKFDLIEASSKNIINLSNIEEKCNINPNVDVTNSSKIFFSNNNYKLTDTTNNIKCGFNSDLTLQQSNCHYDTFKNHVQSTSKSANIYKIAELKSPKKVLQENHDKKYVSPNKCLQKKNNTESKLNVTPKICGIMKLPEGLQIINEFQEWNDEFINECWDDSINEVEESLDLSVWQRCRVLAIHDNVVKLSNKCGNTGTCRLDGVWRSLQLAPNQTINAIAYRDSSNNTYYTIDNSCGFVVVEPDYLISTTSIVGSVFCSRSTVLQETFRSLDCANKIMTIGSLVHELFQIALTKNVKSTFELSEICSKLLSSRKVIQMLYEADMSHDEALNDINKFNKQICDFVCNYIGMNVKKNNMKLDKIVDIEENIYCPTLGVKGKIDVTVQVNSNGRDELLPLELKTGRASNSVEHRGQLILYNMMLANTDKDPKMDAALRGLLLYLKETISLKEVKSGYPERRDLVMLRNQLAQYMKPTIDNIDDIEDLCLKLPGPINHPSACRKCPYLTICQLHLWHTDCDKVSSQHPLYELREKSLGHLSLKHIAYFKRWYNLLNIESTDRISSTNTLADLWNMEPMKREARGKCLSCMKVINVMEFDGRYRHTFVKANLTDYNVESCGLIAGDYVVISKENRINIAAGFIITNTSKEIIISLERDLLMRNSSDTEYSIDSYDSQSISQFAYTNLAALLGDQPAFNRLRSLIIDRIPPKFAKKLPHSVLEIGSKLLKCLNIDQQRACLKAVGAEDYLLIKGMPGTGKTQCITQLIQLLVALGMSVVVTSQTHSAVDNVLSRLPSDIKCLRLGPVSRISRSLHHYSEPSLTSHCTDSSMLSEVYKSVSVVGVTCMGANHVIFNKRSFDVCLVDESTQVLHPVVLGPLFAAHKFILIGDPEQLPPIVTSQAARRNGMDESLFSLLDGPHTTNLTLQYRMNGQISRLANLFTYNGMLKCANETVENSVLHIKNCEILESSQKWLRECLSDSLLDSIKVLDTGPTGSISIDADSKQTCHNMTECKIVKEIVGAMLEVGIEPDSIGVITPYRDQVNLIRSTLSQHMIEINTVDQYQGRDKSVIVYSCCKTRASNEVKITVKDSEILEDKRRLTVAITRAKHKFIIVGDMATLKHYKTFNQLFQSLNTMNVNFTTI